VIWTDTVFCAFGLIACEAGLDHGHGAPWMKNLVIGSGMGSSCSERPLERLSAMGVLSTAGLWSGVRAKGRDAHVSGWELAVNDIVNWFGSHAAFRIYVEAHRRYARLRDQADTLALERATARASEAERSRQHRQVHRATADALRSIAECRDANDAISLARSEAGRLRTILQSRGETPALVQGLHEAIETLPDSGVRVEMVMTELIAEPPSEVVAAVQKTVHLLLLAALKFDRPERVVVRATSQDDNAMVTVRYQGFGFTPGGGSDYESCVMQLASSVAEVGGSADIWSAEGRGVRLTMVTPVVLVRAAQSPVDDSLQGAPHGRTGVRRTHDGDRVRGNGDLDGRTARLSVRTAQNKIRWLVLGDLEASTERDAFKASPHQGLSGQDLGADSPLHVPSLTGGLSRVVVTNAPFGSDGGRDRSDEGVRTADRTILAALFAFRTAGLATGLAALVASGRRYRSVAAAYILWGLAALESVWFARRLHRSGHWPDRTASAIDALTAVATVAVGRANVRVEDRWTWINWGTWGFAPSAAAGQAADAHFLGTGAAGTAAIALAVGTLSKRVPEMVANSGAMVIFFAGGQLFVRQIHGVAARLEAARKRAIEEGTRLAAERERTRQLRMLHDSALQTLEAVGSLRYADLPAIKDRASMEAQRLHQQLSGETRAFDGTFRDELWAIVHEYRGRGLEVDLRLDDVVPLPSGVAAALVDACREALTNVAKHAGVSSATVEVCSTSNGVEVVVVDAGRGFDPLAAEGFGIAESIKQRLAEANGRAQITSSPGRGTRIVLWGPS
jgi:signal transduction histidine kinase